MNKFIFLFTFFSISILQAQISDKILKVEAPPTYEKEQVIIKVELMPGLSIDKIEIAYRSVGQTEFKRSEMSITSNIASITIHSDYIIPPALEYYLIIYEAAGKSFTTFPVENPTEDPLKISILPIEKQLYEIVWISPASDERLRREDLQIGFHLYKSEAALDLSRTRIFIDQEDLSSFTIRSEDIFVLKPDNFLTNLKEGKHTIRVEVFDIEGKKLGIETRNFTFVEELTVSTFMKIINYKGSFQIESRNESIAGSNKSHNRVNINTVADYGIWKLNGRLYATNEEKLDRQPQNRYYIGVESPWLKIGYGDSYPMLPTLILNGKRVRGLTSNINVGWFNLDFIYGSIDRKIESKITIVPDSLLGMEPAKSYFKIDSMNWARVDKPGVFTRNLFAIRPSFGRGEKFLFGLSFLKSKDDKNSIMYGLMPKENLVLGSDLLFAFDKRRIEFISQIAFSATNKDISRGNITDSEIDTVFKSLSEEERKMIRTMRDVLSDFITINKDIVPLSFKNLTTLSYEASLNLNYFNNNIRCAYIRRGKSFESFGQSDIRTDVNGFNLSDRIRLLNNRLLLLAAYEILQDNTAKLKESATRYTTFNTTASYYPTIDFPSITIGYMRAATVNELNDKTYRFFTQMGYSFKFLEKQKITFSFSTSKRDDQSLKNFDTENNNFTLGLNTFYSIPLLTTVSVAVNSSRYLSPLTLHDSVAVKKINYISTLISANYHMFENKLLLDASIRPTFGDIKRGVYEFGAQYTISKNLDALGRFSLYTYKDVKNDIVSNLIIRYSFY